MRVHRGRGNCAKVSKFAVDRLKFVPTFTKEEVERVQKLNFLLFKGQRKTKLKRDSLRLLKQAGIYPVYDVSSKSFKFVPGVFPVTSRKVPLKKKAVRTLVCGILTATVDWLLWLLYWGLMVTCFIASLYVGNVYLTKVGGSISTLFTDYTFFAWLLTGFVGLTLAVSTLLGWIVISKLLVPVRFILRGEREWDSMLHAVFKSRFKYYVAQVVGYRLTRKVVGISKATRFIYF